MITTTTTTIIIIIIITIIIIRRRTQRMSGQDIKILENVLEMSRECLKTLKRRAGFGESCGKRGGLGITTRPGCRK